MADHQATTSTRFRCVRLTALLPHPWAVLNSLLLLLPATAVASVSQNFISAAENTHTASRTPRRY